MRFWKLLGLSLAWLLPMTAAGEVLTADDGHLSVSSAGVRERSPSLKAQGVGEAAGRGVFGSPGRREVDVPLDALAEFRAARASAAEFAESISIYRPIVPSYVRPDNIAETVIGSDARYRILPRKSGYPEQAIGLLTGDQGGNSFYCTGFLIGPNTVATAGHCVHQGNAGVWSTNVRFYPARNGSSSPFGSCAAGTLFSVAGWVDEGNEDFDYGAVKLNCSVGSTTGFFGFFWQAGSLSGLPVQVSGYPSDKTAWTHWSTSGDIAVSETAKTRYRHDTAAGQSGGPVFETDRSGSSCTGACVNSIHAYGVLNGTNSGTRINQSVFDNLLAWRNAS
jgi:glutamyl endopeptidase